MLMLYLIEGSPTCAQFLISVLDLFDIAIALRTLRQHDRRMLLIVDIARRQHRRPNAITSMPFFVRKILHAAQLIHRRMRSAPPQVAGYPQIFLTPYRARYFRCVIVRRRALAPELHQHRL